MAAAEVEHGRRRGTPKSIRTANKSFTHVTLLSVLQHLSLASGEPTAEKLRKGQVRVHRMRHPCHSWLFTPPQTLVIPHAEWLRITSSLSSADKKAEEAKARADARKAMHEASKAMVKSWDNTIEVGARRRFDITWRVLLLLFITGAATKASRSPEDPRRE